METPTCVKKQKIDKESEAASKRNKTLMQCLRSGYGSVNQKASNSKFIERDDFATGLFADLRDIIVHKGIGSRFVLGTIKYFNNEHACYVNKDGKPADQIMSIKAYQLFTFYRYLCKHGDNLVANPTADGILTKWKELFADGKGQHCRHTCNFDFEGKKCVTHLEIGSRVLNEIDKHVHYWYYHQMFGQRFQEWISSRGNEDILAHVKNHIFSNTE
jgi:hypothetical protein